MSATTGVSGPRSLPTTEQSIRRQRIARTLTYSFLIAVAIVYIFPFLIAIATSFKTEPNATANPLGLAPSPVTTSDFHELYKDNDFATWVKNSAIVTLSITFLRSSWTASPATRWRACVSAAAAPPSRRSSP